MTTTPDLTALEAEALDAANRLTEAQTAIASQREANRQAYQAAVHQLAAEAVHQVAHADRRFGVGRRRGMSHRGKEDVFHVTSPCA